MFETPTSDILSWYEALREEAKKLPDMPELLLGREYHCDMELLELLRNNDTSELEAARMGDGEGLLIEFSNSHNKEEILQYIALVKYCGFIPIVAHAERYAAVEEDPTFAGEMAGAGAWLQVNAASFLGDDGRIAKKLSLMLLKNDLIRLIGTDAHRTDMRIPNLDVVVYTFHTHYIYGKIEKTGVISCPEALPASPKPAFSTNHNIYGHVSYSTTRYMGKHEQQARSPLKAIYMGIRGKQTIYVWEGSSLPALRFSGGTRYLPVWRRRAAGLPPVCRMRRAAAPLPLGVDKRRISRKQRWSECKRSASVGGMGETRSCVGGEAGSGGGGADVTEASLRYLVPYQG